MKGTIVVLSATSLVTRLPIQLNLLSVRMQHLRSTYLRNLTAYATFLYTAEFPRITTHPQKLKKIIPGNSAKFTVQATGTEPLNYNWQWKPADKGSGSKEWKPCDEGLSDGFTLTIPSVQKPNEGSYRCVISNHAGTEISKAAQLSVGVTDRT